jgi:hypothetical protein
MQFSNLFFAVLFSSAVIADEAAEQGKGRQHHRHHHEGRLQRECDHLFHLERVQRLVTNSTALAQETHNNETKISELQAEATQEATELTNLRNNQTLIRECEILAAEEKLERDCFKLLKLEHFLTFAANSTAVSKTAENNSTKISEIAAEASKSAGELQQLQSNGTFVALCLIVNAHEREKHECEEIKELEKFIAFSHNETALAEKTHNNETRINEIQAESSRAADRLAQLQSNSTLVSDCATFFEHPTNVESQAGKSFQYLTVLNCWAIC